MVLVFTVDDAVKELAALRPRLRRRKCFGTSDGRMIFHRERLDALTPVAPDSGVHGSVDWQGDAVGQTLMKDLDFVRSIVVKEKLDRFVDELGG